VRGIHPREREAACVQAEPCTKRTLVEIEIAAVCRDVAAIAEGHFADAARAMARCSRRAMRPAAVMGAFYRAMLDALLRAGWRDPAQRISLSKAQKLWLVLRHGLL